MTWCVLLLCLVSAIGCDSRKTPTGPVAGVSTSRPGPAQDYAGARAGFRTHLIRHGPSPESPSAVHFTKLRKPSDVELVGFRSGDLRLKGWATLGSSSEGKRPAVLFLHGGWGFDESDWEHTRAFRQAGYVVLAPMLRGENGCPGSFSMFYDEVDDVLAAGDYLAGRPDVDPSRVYLAGYSAGGTLALLAALATDRFRAVAALDGSPDRRTFVQGREEEVPFDVSNLEEFRMRSPSDFARDFRCPTKVYCSDADGGYVEVSRRLTAAARAAGRDVELVVLVGDHTTFREPATQRAIEFFRTR
jgi:dipeptidyl aminopeptidase/acylaminoacyl peptidase